MIVLEFITICCYTVGEYGLLLRAAAIIDSGPGAETRLRLWPVKSHDETYSTSTEDCRVYFQVQCKDAETPEPARDAVSDVSAAVVEVEASRRTERSIVNAARPSDRL